MGPTGGGGGFTSGPQPLRCGQGFSFTFGMHHVRVPRPSGGAPSLRPWALICCASSGQRTCLCRKSRPAPTRTWIRTSTLRLCLCCVYSGPSRGCQMFSEPPSWSTLSSVAADLYPPAICWAGLCHVVSHTHLAPALRWAPNADGPQAKPLTVSPLVTGLAEPLAAHCLLHCVPGVDTARTCSLPLPGSSTWPSFLGTLGHLQCALSAPYSRS